MKKTAQKTDMKHREQTQLQQEDRGVQYFDNLARITSTLLAAILALLTFLLVVGAQNSIKGFSVQLYAAIATLGAGLILYAVGYMIREFYYAMVAKTSDQETARQKKTKILVAKLLRGTRILQQLVFIASMGAVVWFAIIYAQLFLNPKPVAQPQPTSSQQRAPSSSGSGPAAGETAEQHAKESQQTQQTQP